MTRMRPGRARVLNEVTERVGYVGLGDMGGGIATHLARSGVDLTVYDVSPAAVERLVVEGANAATSPANLMGAVDIAVVCVYNAAQVRDVVHGQDGLLSNARAGQVIVVQSTVPPDTVLAVAEVAADHGVGVVDAPVSGNTDDRLNGTLVVMVGGEDTVLDRVSPLLATIGDPVIVVGPLGSGAVAKLANNTIMQATRNAALEVMAFAAAFGLSEAKIREACRAGSAQSWVLANWEYYDYQAARGAGAAAPQVRETVAAAAGRGVDLPLSRALLDLHPEAFRRRRELLAARDNSPH
jgi:3-hydroxyisobutyrate dehydrogenase